MQAQTGLHLVATYKNQIVGFLDADTFRFHANQYSLDSNLHSRNNLSEIYSLYFLENFQRMGLGTLIFQTGLKMLSDRGYTHSIAWVLKDNINAIAFYKKMNGKCLEELTVSIGEKNYLESAYEFKLK